MKIQRLRRHEKNMCSHCNCNNANTAMSLHCCETPATTLTTCASVDAQRDLEAQTNFITNVPLNLARAPYRMLCVSSNAPLSFFHGGEVGDPAATILVYLTLQRIGPGLAAPVAVDTQLMQLTLAAGSRGGLTPILTNSVEPALYNVECTVFSTRPVDVSGKVSATASVQSLLL